MKKINFLIIISILILSSPLSGIGQMSTYSPGVFDLDHEYVEPEYFSYSNNNIISTSTPYGNDSERTSAVVAMITSSSSYVCSGKTIVLTITASGGSGNYTYFLNAGDGYNPSTDPVIPVVPKPPITYYSAYVEDDNGVRSDEVFISVRVSPQMIIEDIKLRNSGCDGECTGRAEIIMSGGVAPFEYSWNSLTNVIENLCEGTYKVTITDAYQCKIESSFFDIVSPLPMEHTMAITPVSCYGRKDGSAEITVTAGQLPYTYLWSNGWQDPTLIDGKGDYTLTVTDANDCSITVKAEITSPDLLSLQPLNSNYYICEGDEVNILLNAKGGTEPYTYLWDSGIGYLEVPDASLNFSPNVTAQYSGIVRDANGCVSNVIGTNIIVSNTMTIDAVTTENNKCYESCDGKAELTFSGGISPFKYSWASNNNIQDKLCAGTHNVTITDNIGCSVATSFIIEEPTPMTYSTNSVPASCFGYDDGEASISVQGGTPPYFYIWTSGIRNPGINSVAGNYSVTVTDNNGCRVEETISITEPSKLMVLPINNRTICIGQSTTFSTQATGGTPSYSYLWTDSKGNNLYSNVIEVSPTEETTYTLVATDSKNCQSDPVKATVSIHPQLEIISILTSNDLICPGEAASIYVDVRGGNGGPYIITLDDNTVVGPKFTVYPQESTTYNITLSDMCGTPSVSGSIKINVRQNPIGNFVTDKTEGCPPLAIKFFDSSAEEYNYYLWNFGDNAYSEERNPVHVYTTSGSHPVSLEVKDDYGCKFTKTINNFVDVYQKPIASFEATPDKIPLLYAEIDFTNYSQQAIKYYWDFGDGNTSSEQHPFHVYEDAGEFEVILVAENERTCKDTTIRIVNVENILSFYVPTAFTPNGDGQNDCFKPCGNGINKNNFKFIVFDQWGEVVYETNIFNPDAGCSSCGEGSWDGTKNGDSNQGDKILANGLYVWYCEFQDWNGISYQKQGKVNLIR